MTRAPRIVTPVESRARVTAGETAFRACSGFGDLRGSKLKNSAVYERRRKGAARRGSLSSSICSSLEPYCSGCLNIPLMPIVVRLLGQLCGATAERKAALPHRQTLPIAIDALYAPARMPQLGRPPNFC